jgi:uncharacterized membrane protein YedE/YeeE
MIGKIIVFLCGLVFAIGLGVSGMTQPDKVVNFLDFVGNWDPSLVLVMFGGVATYFVGQRLTLSRKASVFGGKFQLPTRMDLDARLIGGAALFGIGWGMAGFCPGPALVSAVSGNSAVLTFIMSMSLGMYFFEALHLRHSHEPDGGASPLDSPASHHH